MKILPGLQQATPAAQSAAQKSEKVETPAQPKAAQASRVADHVDFSASLSAGLKAQQVQQAARVESIKARIKTGGYQVSSRDVAEKMLSGSSDF